MSAKQDKKEASTDYQKCYIVVDAGKTYEVLYNPNEKDSLKAYIKKEIN